MLSAVEEVFSAPTPEAERQSGEGRTSRAQAVLVATSLGALLSALACAGPGSGSGREPSAGPAAELQTAVQKLATAESIKFSVFAQSTQSSVVTGDRTTQLGAPIGSGGGGSTWASGVWGRGLPLKLARKERVAYTKGDKVVHQTEAGEWKVLDVRAPWPGDMDLDAGQSGSGAAATEEVVQGKTRATSADSRNELRELYSLGSIQSPAEVFADFASKVGDVQKTTQGDATVYSGKLTTQGARSLGRQVSGAHDEGGTDGQASGTYSVTVKDGAATEAVFVLARSGRDGDRTIAAISTRTYKIQKVGDVAFEVPPPVLELLD
jgi:hypothetical protein